MKKGILILLLHLSITTVTSYAQSALVQQLKLPQIAPASPDAAAIEKFGNFPVTYSTGVPSISIPLWTIQCGSLSWPFALSYHAGGIKVDESASIAGLGWNIDGPGVITRSVNGRPDEEASVGEPTDFTNITSSNYSYLYNVAAGVADAELDLFNFSFNGKSGKFVITHEANPVVLQIPQSNLKITYTAGLHSFTITDENGIVYIFDLEEQTQTNSGAGTLIYYTTSWYLTKVELPDKNNVIEFAYDYAGSIGDQYKTYTQVIGEKYVQQAGLDDPVLQPINDLVTVSTSSVNISLFKLTGVTFPNGSLIFNYDAVARKDIGGNTVYNKLTSLVVNESVNGISTTAKAFLFNQSYFHYNPTDPLNDIPANWRLKLNNVVEAGSLTGPSLKQYSFSYNEAANIHLSPRGSTGQDNWGFNNAKTNNPSLLQSENVSYFDGQSTISKTVGDADRSVDAAQMKAWMLTSITYPTGGKTEFEYEPHVYATNLTLATAHGATANIIGNQAAPYESTQTFIYPSVNIIDGSTRLSVDMSRFDFPNVSNPTVVRLRDITSTPFDVYVLSHPRASERYTFEIPLTLQGGHTYELKATLYTTVSNSLMDAKISVNWSEAGTVPDIRTGGGLRIKSMTHYTNNSTAVATKETFLYDTAVTLTPFHLINQRYKEVTYQLGIAAGNGCALWPSPICRVYHAQSVYALANALGSPMLYRRVQKINVDPTTGTPNGMSEYVYDVFQDPTVPIGGPLALGAGWTNGFLTSETHYRYSGGSYMMLQKTENEYNYYKSQHALSFRVEPKLIIELCFLQHSASTVFNDLRYYTVDVFTGSKRLAKQTVTEVDEFQHNLVTTTTNYYGSSDYDYPTAMVAINSKNIRDSITYKHSPDLAVPGNVYDKMKQQNMLQPVIEQVAYSNTTKLSTVKNNYRDWFNNQKVIALDTVQASIFNNALETRLRYYSYDAYNNPLSMGKDKDQPASYLWGYNNARPVAQVTNANSSSIAHTSFETSETGGWSGISGIGDYLNGSITGRLAWTKSNFNFSKSGLGTTTAYIISYWSKNGSYTVNSTSGTAGRSVSGWTFYSHKVTPSTGTVTVTGSGSIDELRLYPALLSQMTTYTYDPLGGVTSICDPNSRILYYEYDELQRPILIRDQDKNIVKKFSYNYNGITEYPNIYYNTAQSVTVPKTGCSGCQIGTMVTYTVPAGVYLSTQGQTAANNLAHAEAVAKAPGYANANGSCITPPISAMTKDIPAANNFSIVFHNNCTGTNYSYTLNHNSGGPVPLSSPPAVGNYNVTITKLNGPGTYFYLVNGYSFSGSSDPPMFAIDVIATGNTIFIQ